MELTTLCIALASRDSSWPTFPSELLLWFSRYPRKWRWRGPKTARLSAPLPDYSSGPGQTRLATYGSEKGVYVLPRASRCAHIFSKALAY